MKIKSLAGIATLTLFLFIGCSGNNANIKNLSESESKAIQQNLLDSWSDYDISYDVRVIVFDPKNDDKKILVHSRWQTVKEQETWTQIVNGTIVVRSQWGHFDVWGDPIREIWVHNQFYGYVSHKKSAVVAAKIVDENTVFLNRQWGNILAGE
jgi:putative SOS response-associated peptidase YedK